VADRAAPIWPAIAAAFGHRLHAAGVPVTPERSACFAAAVDLVQPRSLEQLYWGGRVTLLTDPSQVPTYDEVFRSVFRAYAVAGTLIPAQPAATAERAKPTRPAVEDEDPAGTDAPSVVVASPLEQLAERPFDQCTADELALIARLVEQLPMLAPARRGRRARRHPHGRRLDVRSTLRRARSTGGDPVRVVRRKRVDRLRRVVLIADVSGSMQTYARIYLHLMRGAVKALPAEAFVFSTRLTRLTRTLREGSPDAAYRLVSEAAPDWAGGTRIGAALTAFLDEHGRRGLARGAVVVILSDGWEVGDTARLAEAMARLHRLAYHVIWVNPRSARAAYRPIVGGMAAALPHVDTFRSGHSLDAIGDVLTAISGVAELGRGRAPVSSTIP
jgi:uncharacterized protein with von Willebrand factor type A (vWA) domain